MRISSVLLRRFGKFAPGKIDSGKNRIYPGVNNLDLAKLRKEFQVTQNNITLLRHPYLTAVQSHGHEDELRDFEGEEFTKVMEKAQAELRTRRKRDITLEERYNKMRNADSWDAWGGKQMCTLCKYLLESHILNILHLQGDAKLLLIIFKIFKANNTRNLRQLLNFFIEQKSS